MNSVLKIKTPILSEDFANALRHGDIKNAGKISPYFACLFPLLETLGWTDYQRDVIESLPHYSNHLDLTDLRNVLVNLGYESQDMIVNIKDIKPQLLPALFIGNKGQIFLLLERNEKSFNYYDGNKKDYVSGPLKGTGTIYVFTDTNLTHAVSNAQSEEWFSSLIRRFQSLIKHLLAMTFVLNLITISVPIFIMSVYDKIIGSKSLDSLPYFVAAIALAFVIEFGFRLLRATTLATIAGRIDYLIGSLSFKQILGLPPIMTERSSVTSQLSKIREFDSIREFFVGQSATAVLEIPFIIMFITVIAILGGWLALIPCMMALGYIIFGLFWLPLMRRHLRNSALSRTAREKMLMETFGGLRELKATGSEDIWLERFKETTADVIVSNRTANIDHAILNSVTSTMMMLSATLILAFGTLQVMSGVMSVGALIAVMTLSWRVQAPLQGIFISYFRFETVLTGIKDLNALMSINTEKHGRKSSLLSGKIEGHVTFDRVSFKYGPALDPAVIGISFNIKPKTFVAIAGHNGSGKSTILKLINGMYPMQSGTVYIDNVDTRQFNPSDLRRMVAYVPQNPSLFRGTIAQNLRLKDPLATDDDIRLACFKTGILKMIEGLPDGFNTIVGDEYTLSLPGSLVRGICIARAFVCKSPILLLDEPGSALDSDSDEALMLQLKSIKGQITVIMVSHRPSHIKIADCVLEIERGMSKRMRTPKDFYKPGNISDTNQSIGRP